jgi:hypothetical protein
MPVNYGAVWDGARRGGGGAERGRKAREETENVGRARRFTSLDEIISREVRAAVTDYRLLYHISSDRHR